MIAAMAAVHERFQRVLGTEVQADRRDDRWLAMTTDRVAFAADDDTEWARLRAEARLIARWRAAGVPVPRILDENERERVQVRERLDGIMGEVVEPLLFGTATLADVDLISPFTRAGTPLPWSLPDAARRFDPGCPLSPFGERLAQSYGEISARIHAAVSLDEAAELGITTRRPFELDDAIAKLRATSIPRELVEAADRERAWIAAAPPVTCVIHGDLHFHNMCLAPDGSIIGLFDVGDAHVDGPESEFHYIHSLGPRFVEGVLRAYHAPIDIAMIRRAHVRTALGHLTWVAPDSQRYPRMLSWVTAVLTAFVLTRTGSRC